MKIKIDPPSSRWILIVLVLGTTGCGNTTLGEVLRGLAMPAAGMAMAAAMPLTQPVGANLAPTTPSLPAAGAPVAVAQAAPAAAPAAVPSPPQPATPSPGGTVSSPGPEQDPDWAENPDVHLQNRIRRTFPQLDPAGQDLMFRAWKAGNGGQNNRRLWGNPRYIPGWPELKDAHAQAVSGAIRV